MCQRVFPKSWFSYAKAHRQSLRLQLQETDSLFQSTKAQQDEYLKKIASLEAERDRLKEQVAELEETTRDLYTHLSTSRCDDFALEYSRSLCLVARPSTFSQDIVRQSGAQGRANRGSAPLSETQAAEPGWCSAGKAIVPFVYSSVRDAVNLS